MLGPLAIRGAKTSQPGLERADLLIEAVELGSGFVTASSIAGRRPELVVHDTAPSGELVATTFGTGDPSAHVARRISQPPLDTDQAPFELPQCRGCRQLACRR